MKKIYILLVKKLHINTLIIRVHENKASNLQLIIYHYILCTNTLQKIKWSVEPQSRLVVEIL